MDSIFDTVKKALGVDSTYLGFDTEILLGINTAIMTLTQLGIGPSTGFIVTGTEETWNQLIGTSTNLEGVKSYIQLKTRLFFDPPSNSFLLEAFNRQIEVLEWRLNTQAELNVPEEGTV